MLKLDNADSGEYGGNVAVGCGGERERECDRKSDSRASRKPISGSRGGQAFADEVQQCRHGVGVLCSIRRGSGEAGVMAISCKLAAGATSEPVDARAAWLAYAIHRAANEGHTLGTCHDVVAGLITR